MKRQRCGLVSNYIDRLFCFVLDYFVLVLFAFAVLHLVSSVLCQEFSWEERLRNDLFCVKWDVEPLLVSQLV